MSNDIKEEEFPSDEELEENSETDSESDLDEKVANEDIFDDEFQKCYMALKNKDPKIYDPEVKFFEDETREEMEKPSTSTHKPRMTLLDHQLKFCKKISEEEHSLSKPIDKSYYEKDLEEIKKKILEEVQDMDDSEESSDELLQTRDDNVKKEQEEDGEFFSKNLDAIVEDLAANRDDEVDTKGAINFRSDEINSDKLFRIPRNATNTIRDLQIKQKKKEKRLQRLEVDKKKKKIIKEADCEDYIDDIPTKFHYQETTPNDYGLSPQELLYATEEELEKWISIKKALAYKTPEQELYDKKEYDKRRNDLELKKKIFKSLYGSDSGEEETLDKVPKNDAELLSDDPATETTNKSKRKKKKKRVEKRKKFADTGVAPDRMLAYGISKNKLKKSRLL